MIIKIIVKNKKKGIIEIPLTKKEISAMFQAGFMADEMFETLKLNNVDVPFFSLHRKFLHLLNDVIDGGKTYSTDKKTHKFKLNRKRYYIVKKPKWKKENV